ncbi:MAG: calcium-binding protein [Pseudomonadota bacterium]
MAGIIASSSSVEVEISTGDEIYVPETVSIAVTAGRAIDSDNTGNNNRRVVVDGTVVSTGSNAIRLADDASELGLNFVTVGREGVARTLNLAVNAAVWVFGSESLVENAGEISGLWGIYVQAYDGSGIINSGIASGGTNDASASGILMDGSSGVQVQNSGLVVGANGVVGTDSDFTLRNSGEISGYSLAGVDASQSTPTGAVTIVNSGLISGLTAAIIGTGFDDVVRNDGRLVGAVDLGDGADVYRGFEDGAVMGAVLGGVGEDDLRGSRADDALNGGADADQLRGRRGDDDLTGGAADDFLYGGRGDDLLAGGGGKDALRGGADEDMLLGGGGAAELFGGRGDDEMTGGGGADRYVVRRGGGEDVVTDFADDADKLDLSAFGFARFNQVKKLASRADGGVLIDLDGVGGGSVQLEGLGFNAFDGADVIL